MVKVDIRNNAMTYGNKMIGLLEKFKELNTSVCIVNRPLDSECIPKTTENDVFVRFNEVHRDITYEFLALFTAKSGEKPHVLYIHRRFDLPTDGDSDRRISIY